MAIELVHSPVAGQVERLELRVAAGTSLAQALVQSGVVLAPALKVGIWGRVMPPDTLLRDRDRIEIYRPLTVDPKEARRLRYRSPGDKSKRVRPNPRR
ncbi:MAG: RnfH family protein [Burkholderiaceae bacterium]|nr:RnfH family protein [Burkholderiaceae bacterium]